MTKEIKIEVMPENTKQLCSCSENKSQAILKNTFPSGQVIFNCRDACKRIAEKYSNNILKEIDERRSEDDR